MLSAVYRGGGLVPDPGMRWRFRSSPFRGGFTSDVDHAVRCWAVLWTIWWAVEPLIASLINWLFVWCMAVPEFC